MWIIYFIVAFVAFTTTSTGITLERSAQNNNNQTTPETEQRQEDHNLPACTFTIQNTSVNYWKGQISSINPHFVQFTLRFNHNFTSTNNVMMPNEWVWTFTPPRKGKFPVLQWPLDHGILSFGLLNSRTLDINYVLLEVVKPTDAKDCYITLGENTTTWNIVSALKTLVSADSHEGHIKYDNFSFCDYHYETKDADPVKNFLALYFRYPYGVASKFYQCCNLQYNYHESAFHQSCGHKKYAWSFVVFGPYFMGLAMFLYWPIMFFNLFAWLSKNETVRSGEYQTIASIDEEEENRLTVIATSVKTKWVFLDGISPFTFSDAIYTGFNWFGEYTVLRSKCVRFGMIILIPLTMLPQLLMYKYGVDKHRKITICYLMKIGNPSNFLALLCKDPSLRVERFVPIFGGPVGMLVMYFLFGIILVVIPRSLKQVVENGLPTTRAISLLCLSPKDISVLSRMPLDAEPGYAKAAATWKNSVYMLFSNLFWIEVYSTHKSRFLSVANSNISIILRAVLFLLLFVMCFVETILCIIYYGSPLFGSLLTVIKGAVVSLRQIRVTNQRFSRFWYSPYCTITISISMIVSCTIFTFAIVHIFMQVFQFISQIILFCFISIFTYPTVAFGYLFFFIMLTFYIISVVKQFGKGYLDLLRIAVNASLELEEQVNTVHIQDDCVYLTNLRATGIKAININGIEIDVSKSSFRQASRGKRPCQVKALEKRNMYGIPEELFYLLIQKHRPVHVQMVQLMTRVGFLVVFVITAMWVSSRSTTGPTSEISEVMHVIFIVCIGTVPHLIEELFTHENVPIKQEIESRAIKNTITEFWLEHEDRDIYDHANLASYGSYL